MGVGLIVFFRSELLNGDTCDFMRFLNLILNLATRGYDFLANFNESLGTLAILAELIGIGFGWYVANISFCKASYT